MSRTIKTRFGAALLAGVIHFGGSVLIALVAAIFVFGFWYPFPYNKMAGGIELFLLVVCVDITIGPLLTLVLFNPSKPKAELKWDLIMVIVLQLGALGYGVWTVWQARPLFMVAELDRFKVITKIMLDDKSLSSLPLSLKPDFFSGPITVSIREPNSQDEKTSVLFESLYGGRDYGERPDFYRPYDDIGAAKSLVRARPLLAFLKKFPMQREKANEILIKHNLQVDSARYLPVIAKQEWIALLDEKGFIIGYLRGDGFLQ